MSSPEKSEPADRGDKGDLDISAAASHPSNGSRQFAPGQSLLETLALESIRSTDSSAKLPPSPLVTPPMGSNPSYAAQEAISPRNVLLGDASAAVASAEMMRTEEDDDQEEGGESRNFNRGIPHVYHDYAKLSGPGPAYIRKKTGGVTQPFPDKLHEMLSQESSDDPSSAIVSWLPHGRAFIVRKPKEFTADIMPKYFRQTKLTSFQRQLNLYGFRRITQGADSGAYYHPLFLQGRPSLSQRMARQKVKGTGHKQPSDASSEPNFYAMPPVEPENPVAPVWGARYKPTIFPPMQAAPPNQETKCSPTRAQEEASHLINGIDPYSPGLSSLHGAAQLLQGIAAGRAGAFLGPPAAGLPVPTSPTVQETRQKPASFLLPNQLKDAV